MKCLLFSYVHDFTQYCLDENQYSPRIGTSFSLIDEEKLTVNVKSNVIKSIETDIFQVVGEIFLYKQWVYFHF